MDQQRDRDAPSKRQKFTNGTSLTTSARVNSGYTGSAFPQTVVDLSRPSGSYRANDTIDLTGDDDDDDDVQHNPRDDDEVLIVSEFQRDCPPPDIPRPPAHYRPAVYKLPSDDICY